MAGKLPAISSPRRGRTGLARAGLAAGGFPGIAGMVSHVVPAAPVGGVPALAGPAGIAAAELRLDLIPVPPLVARVGSHLVPVAVARLGVFPAAGAGSAVLLLPRLAISRADLVPGAGT